MRREQGNRLVKKYPEPDATYRHIIACMTTCHCSPYWAKWIRVHILHPMSWRSLEIQFSHPCAALPDGFLFFKLSGPNYEGKSNPTENLYSENEPYKWILHTLLKYVTLFQKRWFHITIVVKCMTTNKITSHKGISYLKGAKTNLLSAFIIISIQPLGRFSSYQNPVRRPVWLWHTASWASS